MPALLLRAIVTGFGYKLGAELGRLVAEKVGLSKKEDEKKKKKKAEEDSGYPTGMEDRPGEDPDHGDPDESDAEEDAA